MMPNELKAATLRLTAKLFDREAEACRAEAAKLERTQQRARFTLVVEKDVFETASQSEVEAFFADVIGDNATVQVEGYRYL